MKKNLFKITFVLALLICFQAYGQVTVEWDKTYGGDRGDEFSSVIRTSDGGFLLGGSSKSSASFEKTGEQIGLLFYSDYWIVKTDAEGNIQWDKTMGGTEDDVLTTLTLLDDGGFLIGGHSNSPASGNKTEDPRQAPGTDPDRVRADYWIVRTDVEGNVLWDKTIGGNHFESVQEIIPTIDGGFLLAGYSHSGASGDKSEDIEGDGDFWLVKMDTNGNILWEKSIGSAGTKILDTMVPTPDGGFLMAGSRRHESCDPLDYGNFYYDFYIVKIDATGNQLWDQTYGGCGTEVLRDVVPAPDGGYLLGGDTFGEASGDKSDEPRGWHDYWVIRIDEEGNKLWDEAFGGSGFDNLNELLVTEDGGFLLGGNSFSNVSGDKTVPSIGYPLSDYWLVKIDAAGRKLWDESFGGTDYEHLIDLLDLGDGNYLLGGHSESDVSGNKKADSRGGDDFWLVQIKDEGLVVPPTDPTPVPEELVVQWDATYGGEGYDYLSSAVQTSDGGFLFGGNSLSGVSGNKTLPLKGHDDFWLIKTDEEGLIHWQKAYGADRHDYLQRILPLNDGGYLLAGQSSSEAAGDKTDPLQGEFDFWILRIDAEGNVLWDKAYGSNNFESLSTIIPTDDGGYLLGGSTLGGASGDKTDETQGNYDYWIIKVDAEGNKEWDKAFGGNDVDQLSSIVPASDGGYLLGGSSYSGISGDKTEASRSNFFVIIQGERVYVETPDYWLVKIDASGNMEWDKTYGGDNSDILQALTPTADGGYLLGGSSESGASGDKSGEAKYTDETWGTNDLWLVKVDSDGEKLWDITIGGAHMEGLSEILVREEGGYLLSAYSMSDVSGDKTEDSKGDSDFWLVWIDERGNVLEDQTIGGNKSDYPASVIALAGQEYLLAGYSESDVTEDKSEGSFGLFDYWVVKVGPSEDGGEQPGPAPAPTPGFVVGGGTYDSPAGAIMEDPSAHGRTIFSFHADQKTHDTSLSGKANLTLPRNNFRFSSDSIEWLSVNDHTAYLKGTGTLNRKSGYSFLISAMDNGIAPLETMDTYRMIIWNPDGEVVYDNQPGLETYAAASMPISRGDILIREIDIPEDQNRNMSLARKKEAVSGFKAYPSKLGKQELWLEIPEGDGAEKFLLSIRDMQGKVMLKRQLSTSGKGEKQNILLNTQSWPSGTYLLNIQTGNETYQQKLIK